MPSKQILIRPIFGVHFTNLTVKTMCIICNALNVNLRDIIR